MNNSVAETIGQITKQADPAIRDQVARHLAACNFVSADDPMLNALAVQAAFANQPLRLAQAGGAAVASEAGLARLGDRFEAITWTLMHLKVRNVILSFLLSFILGMGTVLGALKFHPQALAWLIGLSGVADVRLETLEQSGASLHVEQSEGVTCIYLLGEVRVKHGQTDDGINYLYFCR